MGSEADDGGDGADGRAPARGDGRRRLGGALARGAGVGLGVLIPTSRLPRRATALAVGGLLGGATAAASLGVSLAVDAATEAWLRRRGVRRPRLLAAVVAGGVTAAEGWHETRGAGGGGARESCPEPRTGPRARGPVLTSVAGMTFASDERARLAQLLLDKGPHAPTLCEGWSTRDMAAHLWLREHRPDAMAGMFVKPLQGHLDSLTAQTKGRDYAELVRAWADGAPALNPMRLADAQVNAAEHFVHLEDVRRGEAAQGGAVPAPRELSAADQEELYRLVRRMAPMMLRRSEAPVVLQAPGRAPVVVSRGAVASRPPVTVSGEAGELLLWAYGREAVHVTVEGDLDSVRRAAI